MAEDLSFTPSQHVAFSYLDEFCATAPSNDQNENEVVLTGSPGYGKSFLIERLREAHPEIIITATTNKAASLIDGVTIYSLIGLTLKDNYKTGEQEIDYDKAQFISKETIVIDECSMINKELFIAIHTYLKKCKIIYVGDYYQLPPVNNDNFSMFSLGLKMLELTEPCRTDKHDIIHLMDELKTGIVNNVLYKNFRPSDNIKIITDPTELDQLLNDFAPNHDKLLSYTNDNVVSQNFRIRSLTNRGEKFDVNDYIVCKSAVPACNGDPRDLTKIESVMTITKIINQRSDDYAYIKCDNGGTYHVFLNPFSYSKNIKVLASKCKSTGKWKEYFDFKNSVLDIRDIYASTVHSAQGSTYRNVYIDLRDLWKCYNRSELQRLLYVAVSRAKENVYLILFKN